MTKNRTFFRRLLTAGALIGLLGSPLYAQTTLNSTTTSSAVTSSTVQVIPLTSVTGISAGSVGGVQGDILYFADGSGEAAQVNAVDAGSKTVTVSRGVAGTNRKTHVSGTLVYTGQRNRFYNDVPSGSCTTSTEAFLPHITLGNSQFATGVGDIFWCTNSQWVRQLQPEPSFTVAADVLGINRLILNATPKTIANGSATQLFTVTCPTLSLCGGVVFWEAKVTDGTDVQTISGMTTYGTVNKAGTLTSTATYVAANEAKAVSAGTYTLAFTVADLGSGVMAFRLQPTSSLTATSHTVTYTVVPHSGAVTIS